MLNWYGDDALENYNECKIKASRKISWRISYILEADQDTTQGTLHNIAALFPELKETCEVLDNQLDRLEHLALRDLGPESHSKDFVDSKERFLENLHNIWRKASILLSTLPNTGVEKILHNQLSDLREALNELDFIVATERAFFRMNKTMLEHSISSFEGVHKTVGYSYARCIADFFPKPSDWKPFNSDCYECSLPRDPSLDCKDKHKAFRRRLLKGYHPESMDKPSHTLNDKEECEMTWCPIIGAYPKSDMYAAQIIPYTIGERTAAHLLDRHEKDEYECIWGTGNGIMLSHELGKAFEEGSIVLVPIQGEFKMVLLNRSLSSTKVNSKKNKRCEFETPELKSLTIGSIDGQLLRFKTGHRPSLTHLYIHAVMAVLRRRRHRHPGWENDISKVFSGRIWPCSGKLPRRGTIEALAREVGDLLPSQVYHIRRQIIDQPKAVDVAQTEITAKDYDVAVVVAGTWASQKQCKIWDAVADFLWPPG